MKYNKGFAPIVLVAIIVGIFAVGGGAYYAGKNESKKEVKVSEINDAEEVNIEVDKNKELEYQNLLAEQAKKRAENLSAIFDAKNTCTSGSPSAIVVTSPNGGEIYKAGDKITVKWKSCNTDYTPISIMLMKQNPSINYSQDENNVLRVWSLADSYKGTINDGTEQFTLPNTDKDLSSGQFYFITIAGSGDTTNIGSGYHPRDYSDNLFTILSDIKESSEKQIGYIKSIYSKNNINYLTIDYVQYLPCNTDDCVESVKVVNDNPLIRIFPISKDVQIKSVTYPDSSGNYSSNQNLTLSKFKEALDYSLSHSFDPEHPPQAYYPKRLLYRITIENEVVTTIEEVFED